MSMSVLQIMGYVGEDCFIVSAVKTHFVNYFNGHLSNVVY